jgi:hypothetical protein
MTRKKRHIRYPAKSMSTATCIIVYNLYNYFELGVCNYCAKETSILRVLQAIPSPLPVVYSIEIVQAEQN